MAHLEIKLEKIAANTRIVATLLAELGVRLVGVTKCCLGEERVAAAMLSGGATALADSRLANIIRLRGNLPEAELQLLRPPLGEKIDAGAADLYLISNAEQARSLMAASTERRMRFLLMIETGDGREGAPPGEAAAEARRLQSLPGAELAGVATNTACARPDAVGAAALAFLASAAAEIRLSGAPPTVSAGGSGLLPFLTSDRGEGNLVSVTELRCGEALLLGSIPSGGPKKLFLKGGHQDAFRLVGTVLETSGKDGRLQALVDFGLQDVGAAPLMPCLEGIEVSSLTSDYLALDIKPGVFAGGRPRVGEGLAFLPSYYALTAAMTSPFIGKKYV